MRGADIEQSGMFSYVSLESRVAPEHPLRRVRALLDQALESMHRDFERVYASDGRSSHPDDRVQQLVADCQSAPRSGASVPIPSCEIDRLNHESLHRPQFFNSPLGNGRPFNRYCGA